ncbi:hypothetical protein BZA70DRAFT_275222 [Myxozyma melibiosi]|uniref:Uncharacterized protein n=1 Tax=Myxozyma melibiosi TaxID=54550 RepID=A0ABR1FAH9_9ASCO
MDKSRISDFLSNNYIPPRNAPKRASVPPKHPTLIMQDNTTDASHRLTCGCTGDNCVFERVADSDSGVKAVHRAYEEQYHLTPDHSGIEGGDLIVSSSSPPKATRLSHISAVPPRSRSSERAAPF